MITRAVWRQTADPVLKHEASIHRPLPMISNQKVVAQDEIGRSNTSMQNCKIHVIRMAKIQKVSL
jgi:hypothetical protein